MLARSGAFFEEDSPLYTAGLIENYAIASGTTSMAPGCEGTTVQSLTQGGYATLHAEALDPEDENPELELKMLKYQEVAFSGPYDDYSASFADYGIVGTNFLCAIQDPDADPNEADTEGVSWCGNCWAVENSEAFGSVITSDEARLVDGTIGTKSWTSLEADGWTGDVTMDGGVAPYATFGDEGFGALVQAGETVTTYAEGTTVHSWNFGSGPGSILPP
jgi:hypothetical protein